MTIILHAFHVKFTTNANIVYNVFALKLRNEYFSTVAYNTPCTVDKN